jgi:hypothetical protein
VTVGCNSGKRRKFQFISRHPETLQTETAAGTACRWPLPWVQSRVHFNDIGWFIFLVYLKNTEKK